MRNIRSFSSDLDAIVASIDDIKAQIMVVDDKQATSFLKEYGNEDVILVAAYPSSEPASENEDNIKETDTTWLFIVKNMNTDDMTPSAFLDLMESTQQIAADVKQYIVDNNIFNGQVIFSTDPEYCAFSTNWHGYMINIQFDSEGFIDERVKCH